VRDFLHGRLQGEDFSNLTLPESRLLSTPWNLNPRRVRMPHSDAYGHALGGQALPHSPTEESATAEHRNCGHDLLAHAGPAWAPRAVDVALSLLAELVQRLTPA
jgi:hypothetical protein